MPRQFGVLIYSSKPHRFAQIGRLTSQRREGGRLPFGWPPEPDRGINRAGGCERMKMASAGSDQGARPVSIGFVRTFGNVRQRVPKQGNIVQASFFETRNSPIAGPTVARSLGSGPRLNMNYKWQSLRCGS